MENKSNGSTSDYELKGKTAFIAGGSAGIGFAMALAFGQLGMNIVLADSEALHLDAAVEKLRAKSIPTVGLLTSVSNPASLRAAAAKAKGLFGKIHIVCNYAATKIRPSQFFLQQP